MVVTFSIIAHYRQPSFNMFGGYLPLLLGEMGGLSQDSSIFSSKTHDAGNNAAETMKNLIAGLPTNQQTSKKQ